MASIQVFEIREMMRIVLDHLDMDKEMSACLTVCKLWSEIVLDIQKNYQKQLERRGLWGEYLNIRFPFMSEIFTPVYSGRTPIVSPMQAFKDWKRYYLSSL